MYIGNGIGMDIHHVGKSVLHSLNNNLVFKLDNLLHVPSLTKNLISVSIFAKDNHAFFEFYPDHCCVKSSATK